jgi:hypothetical protein
MSNKKYIKNHVGSLMQKTCALLQKENPLAVSMETGLSYHWLAKLQSGSMLDPSVNKIQFLYEHLTKKSLSIAGD